MAYVRYATSDTIYSLNDDTWQIEILRNDVGQSNNHKFEVGPAGVQLIYESPEDDILVPGIVHSRCEVETIWPPDVATRLDDMIEAMVSAEDGVWFMQVYKNNSKDWFGPILIDEVQLQESSAARSCRIVASDGISLLKTVDYNDNGSTYLTDQKIFDDVLTNLQQKWVSYNYANGNFSGAERRLAVCDDMYSEDIWSVTTTPSGTQSALTRRMKLSPHMFSYTNEDNEVEYINCYDLLDSICKTLLLRLYYFKQGWWLMPCYNTEESLTGNVLNWSGVYATGVTLVDTFNYQVDTLNNEKQKGNEWTHTFTPAIYEVTINRDTNNGYIVLGENNVGGGSSVDETGITFTTGDSGYMFYGSVTIDRSALDPTVGVLNTNRLGRYVLQFTIRFGDSAATYKYYNNTITPQPQGLFSYNTNYTTDGNSIVFTPLVIDGGEYSSSSGSFYFHNPDGQVYLFDANEDSTVNIPFQIGIPAVEADVTGITIIPQLILVNRDGESSSALTATINSSNFQLYFVYSQSADVQSVPSFDVVANSSFGRGSIDLGKTFVGQLHESLGGIMVETSVGIFETSSNWSTQRYDYDDECNEVGVREVLAAHYKPRAVERGNIVMRGNGVAPPPFYMFVDDDTTDIYQCINYRLASTPAEVEVTLHKVGTDGQAQTTTTTKGFGKSPLPDPGPGLGKGETFGVGFTSGFDFNDDAAEAHSADWSAVIGSDRMEGYITHIGPSKGVYFTFLGDIASSGNDIVRTVYMSNDGRADNTATWQEIQSAYRPGKNATLRQAIDLINQHVAEQGNPKKSFVIAWKEEAFTGLLDDYDNAQAAFSLRKLDSAYTGNAIQVRNSSGTLLDIGFLSNGELDTTTLATHIGSGVGTVQIFYDQSGNGRNATQSIVSLQPEIASAGTIHEVNGKPAVLFANSYLDTTAVALNPNGEVNTAVVMQFDNVTARQTFASQWGASAINRNFVFQMQEQVTAIRFAYYYTNGSLAIVDQTAAVTANTQYVTSGEFSPGTCEAYYNGVLTTQTNTANITGVDPTNVSNVLRLGALSTSATQLMRGYLQEYIHWSNTTALNGDDISNDINSYYSAF
ncbi:MAG: hypothetical protein P8H24_07370 [Methylophilaceae bacterium]|nr:hypothetical protein [Methylophilaceae bacterium]